MAESVPSSAFTSDSLLQPSVEENQVQDSGIEDSSLSLPGPPPPPVASPPLPAVNTRTAMENIHLLLSFLVDDVVDEQGCQMAVEEQAQVGLACYLYDVNASHLKLSCLGAMLNQIGIYFANALLQHLDQLLAQPSPSSYSFPLLDHIHSEEVFLDSVRRSDLEEASKVEKALRCITSSQTKFWRDRVQQSVHKLLCLLFATFYKPIDPSFSARGGSNGNSSSGILHPAAGGGGGNSVAIEEVLKHRQCEPKYILVFLDLAAAYTPAIYLNWFNNFMVWSYPKQNERLNMLLARCRQLLHPSTTATPASATDDDQIAQPPALSSALEKWIVSNRKRRLSEAEVQTPRKSEEEEEGGRSSLIQLRPAVEVLPLRIGKHSQLETSDSAHLDMLATTTVSADPQTPVMEEEDDDRFDSAQKKKVKHALVPRKLTRFILKEDDQVHIGKVLEAYVFDDPERFLTFLRAFSKRVQE